MTGQFQNFDQSTVRRCSAESHTVCFELVAINVIEFVAMAMPFANAFGQVSLMCERSGSQHRDLRSQSHRSAQKRDLALIIEQTNDWMWRVLVEF